MTIEMSDLYVFIKKKRVKLNITQLKYLTNVQKQSIVLFHLLFNQFFEKKKTCFFGFLFYRHLIWFSQNVTGFYDQPTQLQHFIHLFAWTAKWKSVSALSCLLLCFTTQAILEISCSHTHKLYLKKKKKFQLNSVLKFIQLSYIPTKSNLWYFVSEI